MQGLWELPDDWQWVPLGSLADFINGAAFKPTDWGAEGLPIVRIQNLTDPTRPINRTLRNPGDKFRIADGQMLVSWSATLDVFIWRRGDAWLNQHIFKVEPRGDVVDARYLFFLLKAEIENLKKSEHLHGSTMMHINRGPFMAHPVPLPPMAVQRRIAARIDELFAELDDGEAALGRARNDLETYRKSLLKAAVTGELTAEWRDANPAQETGEQLLKRILADRKARWEADPKNRAKRYKEPVPIDQEPDYVLPPGWTWASLDQVAFIAGGLTVDKKRRPEHPVEVPYLRVANVQRGYLDLSVLKTMEVEQTRLADLVLEAGDVLLNEGGDRDKIGRGWVYEGQIDQCTHQNHVFRARPASASVSPYLISNYLNELGRQFFIDEGKQTTNLASISKSKISCAPIAVPPLSEATAILEAVDKHRTDMNAEVDGLRMASSALRQAILNAAFRGELAQ